MEFSGWKFFSVRALASPVISQNNPRDKESGIERRRKPGPHAARVRRRHLLRQSRHQRDAFRRGARPRAGHALRALPVRGRRDRRGRRLLRGWPDKPAATLLHCGPGLANGLANLHNARRARVPHRQHRRRPGDLSSPARSAAHRRHRRLGARVSTWMRTVAVASTRVGADAAAAVQAARTAPGQHRDADPAVRHLLGRRRHRRHAACRCPRRARSPTACDPADRAACFAAASRPLLLLGGAPSRERWSPTRSASRPRPARG